MIGSSIGNYKILEQLNGDETLKIYRAVDVLLNRKVYIKVLTGEFVNRSDIVERFRHEAAILAKLVHPGVPTLHSLTTMDDRLFMIMEFLDGETLDKVLQRQGKLSPDQAVLIFTQILDSLEYAHKAGITHGDLRTERIFLTETNCVKILGFGTSPNLQVNNRDSRFLTEAESGAGDDIYEVGKIFFEALTGETLPFDKTQEIEPRLRAVTPVIPDRIVEAVTNIFRLQAYEKFQSAGELRRKLLPVDLKNNSTNNIAALTDTKITGNSDINNAAVYSVDFSRGENISVKNAFRQSRSKARGESKSADNALVNWKLAQKNLLVAGAGVLTIVVLHFFFQISFLQSDVAQIEKGLIENGPSAAVEQSAETEQITEPDLLAETDPFAKQIDEKSAETSPDESEAKFENGAEIKRKKSEVVRKPAIVSPPVQFKSKAAPPRSSTRKKEPQQQTRAERLRRAEKILTGA